MLLKKTIKLKFIVLLISSFTVLTFFSLATAYLFLPSNLKERKTILVKSGLSIKQISEILYQYEVIKYPNLFEAVAKLYSLRRPLKSGEYEFTYAITPYQILLKLASGTSIIRKITVHEGTTQAEIIKKINEEERLLGLPISNIPEGYLMPDTYFYSYGDQKEKLISQMKQAMSAALDKVMLDHDPNKSELKTRLEVLTLASIIEKEAGNNYEKPIISGVFHNRLKLNMKLQADPTVSYAITKGQYKLGRLLVKSDLEIDSQYNSYKFKGLPPGPICCPGLNSLKAAVKPSNTKALYFVANGLGGHNFSETLTEHNINVQKYKEFIKR